MNKDTSPSVSIIIVTYNSEKELPSCLDSIIRSQGVCYEVFVVDNASNDKSQNIIEEYSSRLPNFTAILNTENKGLAYANNQPMNLCKGKYLLILNPDTVLKENSLKMLTSYLDAHKDVGVVGPKCLYENGLPHTSYHFNWTIIHALLWRVLPYGIIRSLYDFLARYKEKNVLFVSGACLLISKDLFTQIGGYDDNLFLTVEDAADLCMRVKKKGYRVVYYPDAEIIHFAGRSGLQVKFLALFHNHLGALYYFKKHKGAFQTLILYSLLMVNATIRVFAGVLLTPMFPKRFKDVPRRYLRLIKSLTSEFYFKNE